MRLLAVCPFFAPAWSMGGMVKSTLNMLKALSSPELSVSVVTTNADGLGDLDCETGVPASLGSLRVTYFRRTKHALRARYLSPALVRYVVDHLHDYDHVYSAGLWTVPHLTACMVAMRQGVPFTVAPHGTLMPWAREHHKIRKALALRVGEGAILDRASAVVCSSPLEQVCVRKLRPRARTIVMPNVVLLGPETNQERRGRFRRQYELGDAFTFLFAGRVVKNKGLDWSIEAFALCSLRHTRSVFVIVGPEEGNYAAALRARVTALGVTDRVRFIGTLTERCLEDAYLASDVVVLTSLGENFGMAPAEAMACGVPVLVSETTGLCHWVDQYKAGRVVPLDSEAIAAVMSDMIEQPSVLSRMGTNARRLVAECFSPSDALARFLGAVVPSSP